MFNYIWPLALVLFSNVFYQICTKAVPDGMSPFASLSISYAVAAVISLGLYFALEKDANLMREYSKINWAAPVLGVVIIGLEAGYIYAYKAGWPVSTAQIVQSAALAVILIFVGYFLYKEELSWNKIAGIFVCLGGLCLINCK